MTKSDAVFLNSSVLDYFTEEGITLGMFQTYYKKFNGLYYKFGNYQTSKIEISTGGFMLTYDSNVGEALLDNRLKVDIVFDFYDSNPVNEAKSVLEIEQLRIYVNEILYIPLKVYMEEGQVVSLFKYSTTILTSLGEELI